MALAPTVTLNNGIEMPIIGLGTYLSEERDVEKAVEQAINIGYRHIDTAFLYGNESEIGEAIRKKIKDGTVKREELFITTKLWINHLTYDLAIKSCKEQNDVLGLGYIDLFLIHAPVGIKVTANVWPQNEQDLDPGNTSFVDAWRGLEECVKLGYTKSIGVSNFNHKQIEKILSVCSIKPVNNQVEVNPNVNNLKLIEFCNEHNIIVTAHTPLGRAGESDPTWPAPSIKNAQIIKIAEKYKKSPAQVILRFLVQIKAYPLPKSVKPDRIVENFNIFDFELKKDEMETIKALNTNKRVCAFEPFVNHKDYPFKIEF